MTYEYRPMDGGVLLVLHRAGERRLGMRLSNERTVSGDWEPEISPDDLRIDVFARSYASTIVVELDDGSKTVIERRQRFTVAAGRSEATLQKGAYRLVPWEELEARNPFGSVKARF